MYWERELNGRRQVPQKCIRNSTWMLILQFFRVQEQFVSVWRLFMTFLKYFNSSKNSHVCELSWERTRPKPSACTGWINNHYEKKYIFMWTDPLILKETLVASCVHTVSWYVMHFHVLWLTLRCSNVKNNRKREKCCRCSVWIVLSETTTPPPLSGSCCFSVTLRCLTEPKRLWDHVVI